MKDDQTFQWDPRMLRSLQYFEAVARHGSVKKAANEVGVSASAISHQIRELSEYIGEEIIVRSGRGIKLTDSGTRLFHHASPMFASLGAVLTEVIGRKRRFLRIAVCSSFGPYWLAKIMPDFNRQCPGVELELRLFSHYPTQTEATADAIVTADDTSDGFESITLFDELLVAVAGRGVAVNADGLPSRLVTTDLGPHEMGQEWKDFCRRTGRSFPGSSFDGFVFCTHYTLALSLAKAGVGAALVPDFVADESISAGDLIVLENFLQPSGRTYKLCFKTARSKDPDLKAFAKWIRGHAKAKAAEEGESTFK